MRTSGISWTRLDGLIGYGRIGQVHADSVAVHPRARLTRVFDPVADAEAPGESLRTGTTVQVGA